MENIKANTVEEFFGTLQQSVVETWRKHLKTDKYSKHKALDEYYDDMPELVDDLIEHYMGIHGKVKEYKNLFTGEEYNTIEYLENIRTLVKDCRKTFCEGESELESDCDAILSLIDKTLYQVKELDEGKTIKSLRAFITESLQETFKEEKLNGFRWKTNVNYVLRYNRFEKRFELFEDSTMRGTGRVPMLVIKTNNEENGEAIVRQLQDKYGNGNRQLMYDSTTYGF